MKKQDKTIVSILTYNNIFVDTTLLSKGIYESYIPRCHRPGITIEDVEIEFIGTKFRDKDGNNLIPDSYFENLRKCEFKEYELTPVK